MIKMLCWYFSVCQYLLSAVDTVLASITSCSDFSSTAVLLGNQIILASTLLQKNTLDLIWIGAARCFKLSSTSVTEKKTQFFCLGGEEIDLNYVVPIGIC